MGQKVMFVLGDCSVNNRPIQTNRVKVPNFCPTIYQRMLLKGFSNDEPPYFTQVVMSYCRHLDGTRIPALVQTSLHVRRQLRRYKLTNDRVH